MFEEIFPPHLENIDQIFSVLSKEEKEELIRIMKKLGEENYEI